MPDAYLALGAAELDKGDSKGALAFADQGLAKDQRNIGLHLLRIKVLESVGDGAGVEEELAKLVGLYPDNRTIGLALVGAYVRNKKLDAGRNYVSAAHRAQSRRCRPELCVRQVSDRLQRLRRRARQSLSKLSTGRPDSFRFALRLPGSTIRQARSTTPKPSSTSSSTPRGRALKTSSPQKPNSRGCSLQSGQKGEAEALVERSPPMSTSIMSMLSSCGP